MVIGIGAVVGAIRQAQGGVGTPELMAAVSLPITYAVVVGTVIGVTSGRATRKPRARFDARLQQPIARTLALVVAVPGGILLAPFWSVTTTSTAVFVLAMLGSVLSVGFGTYRTAKASLPFVLGASVSEHGDRLRRPLWSRGIGCSNVP